MLDRAPLRGIEPVEIACQVACHTRAGRLAESPTNLIPVLFASAPRANLRAPRPSRAAAQSRGPGAHGMTPAHRINGLETILSGRRRPRASRGSRIGARLRLRLPGIRAEWRVRNHAPHTPLS